MLPCVHTGSAHADREVALESDAVLSRIVPCIYKLLVQMELDK